MRNLQRLILASAILLTTTQTAQAEEASQTFDIERFRLSTDHNGILDVESAEALRHLRWEVSAWLGYEDDPLVLKRSSTDERVGAFVSHRFGGALLFSLGLWDRLQVGVALPLSISQSADAIDPVQQAPLSGFGVGDVRLIPKLSLWSSKRGGTHLALMPVVTLPSAGEDDYLGSEGLSVRPEIALSHRSSRWRAGINLAYQTRRKQRFSNVLIEDEWRTRIGAALSLTESLEATLSYSLGTLGKEPFAEDQSANMELLGGLGLEVGSNWRALVAGGVGLAEGYGTPDWRLVSGLRYVRARKRAVPEVTRGDADEDGIADVDDDCPNAPEIENGFEDTDGCPDTPPAIASTDGDGDGIVDSLDKCPEAPEDVDTYQDEDGCPDEDNDADGVLDTRDDCPMLAGVVQGNGCPPPDADGDGVADSVDSCPDEAGLKENQGCQKKQLVKIVSGKLEILDRVFFKTNKAKILPKSFPLLNNVAAVLNAHPEIRQVDVEGHTDSRGSDQSNKRLSQRRAQSVVRYLTSQGLARERLRAVGYGEEQPIETNDTDDGRSANRRVEFKLVGGASIDSREAGPGEDSKDN